MAKRYGIDNGVLGLSVLNHNTWIGYGFESCIGHKGTLIARRG